MNKTLSPVIRNSISTVTLLEDDILRVDIDPNQRMELEDYSDLVTAAKHLGEGRKLKNLVVVGKDTVPDHEARVASTSIKGSIYKKADAFVIQSLPQRLVAKLYMNFNKPVVPTAFFTCEDEALEWLRSI